MVPALSHSGTKVATIKLPVRTYRVNSTNVGTPFSNPKNFDDHDKTLEGDSSGSKNAKDETSLDKFATPSNEIIGEKPESKHDPLIC